MSTSASAPVANSQAHSCNLCSENSPNVPSQTSPARAQVLSQKYKTFVGKLTPDFHHLSPLYNFLSWSSKIKANVRLVSFRKDDVPLEKDLDDISTDLEEALATCLNKCSERQLYIIQDLSPQVAKLLGGYLDINPEFFADYLDMALVSHSNPSTMKRAPRGAGNENLEPSPFFRLGDIRYHLPPLRSLEHRKDYALLQFIGPREYCPPDGSRSKLAILEDRLPVDSDHTNVERVAGGHNPIQLEDRRVWPVAMTRHSVAAWFNKGNSGSPGDWLKGVILLDRPFESTQKSLTRLNSRYRPFSKIRSMYHEFAQDTDSRHTYLTSLLHYFGVNEQLRQEVPSPVAILQDVYRIVASEWIAVNAYLERDLNAIEWQLENNNKIPTLDALEQTLTTLFIMRRRNRKYKALAGDQLQLRFPDHWAPTVQDSMHDAMEADFAQVGDLIRATDDRITQMAELITSVMSVIEGKTSNTQNQGLGFLTVLAVTALPFNSLAAILGMQTEYAYGQKNWRKFWTSSTYIAVGFVFLYVCVVNLDRVRGYSRRAVRVFKA